MKAVAEMTQLELAAYVQAHLRKWGIETVLSGGSAVMFYSQSLYVSQDLDMISLTFVRRGVLRQAMQALGFREQGRHFVHPQSPYLVEFPAGPLAVGKEPVKEIREVRLSTGLLKVISPTDCVKDRLCAYYYWNDRQALEQAVLVCRQHPVDLAEVERWSRVEGMHPRFLRIRKRLEGAP